jgi:hypothetical protein
MDPFSLTTEYGDTVSLDLIPRTSTPARMLLGINTLPGMIASTEINRDDAHALAQYLEEFASNLEL